MSGGANDKHALSQTDRDLLKARVAFLDSATIGHNNMDQQLLVLAYKHIGVLDNRIVNLGNAYRAIEQTAETLAARTWYEGFEAGAEFNPQTSGIPHDPPLNPYETRPGATE